MAFKKDSTPDLLAKSGEVVQAFTPELYAHLISLIPTPESAQADHESLSHSFAASLTTPENAGQCEADRGRVNDCLSILLGTSKAVSIKDPDVQQKLGLATPSGRSASAAAALLQPEGVKVTFNDNGQRVMGCQKVNNAKGYQIWGCDGDNPGIAANWRLLNSSPSCKGLVITGLNTANGAWVKIRAMRGKGEAGPWSHIVYLNPT